MADDSKKRGHDGDKALEGLLQKTLARAAETGGCPSPDIVAAYCDGSLDSNELERVEAHFARCPSCREVVARVEVAAPCEVGEEGAQAKPVGAKARSNWVWWDWRWLAPATAVLALVGIWFVRERESTRSAQSALQSPLVAESGPSETAPFAAPPSASRQGQVSTPTPAPAQEPAPPRKKSSPQTVEKEERPALGAGQDRAVKTDTLKSDEERKQRDATSSDLEPPSAPPKTSATNTLAGTLEPANPASPPPNPAFGQASAGAARSAPRMNALKARAERSTELRIPSPNPKVIWRIGASGFVERSTDGGASWQSQQFRPGAQVLAGSSPSPTVCWLAGRGGLALLTANGNDWTTVSPPASVDLVGIVARDESRAILTTADGRQFTTTDGGKTWTLGP